MESDAATQLIRRRAYEISQSDEAGTAEEDWLRAERELLEKETAILGAIAVAEDNDWSDLDDEEHAALEAVHRKGAFA